MWSGHHLLGMHDADAAQARALLSMAHANAFTGDELHRRTVANLFFEDSTRTRVSFSIAAQGLGATIVDLGSTGSSMSKGETLIDTAWTIESMGVDAMVVRASQSGAAQLISEHVQIPVINAGDGTHQHPTQALTDALTIGRSLGRTDSWDFSGLHVVIVGDVISSRVARSNIGLLRALGARVTLCGPAMMCPPGLAALGCEVSNDLDALVPEADVLMMLRIQFERGGGARLASQRLYHACYGLTLGRAQRMKAGAIVMHPGPMNREVEIAGEVADSGRSVIRDQVAGGVLVRKAALMTAMGR
ncbi:MAG: aspartate carbamoyltransferase [Phycisphaerae bacterium]|nr:aspartate carbamoyltransferase [Phycisphaerae bacterium]HCT44371.1 aspartate carbamoyltransferase [Phycisphaerales bacterium]